MSPRFSRSHVCRGAAVSWRRHSSDYLERTEEPAEIQLLLVTYRLVGEDKDA
jgi:hypothetical protein